MQVPDREVLSAAFCGVAEKLAFMFGEPVEKEDLGAAPPEVVLASMTFSGHTDGGLVIAVPADMCAEIAANILGMEPDDEAVCARSIDALKEVLNVTCGHVLTALAGEQPLFDLSVPVVERTDAAGWRALLDRPTTAAFIVDDNPVLLELRLGRAGK